MALRRSCKARGRGSATCRLLPATLRIVRYWRTILSVWAHSARSFLPRRHNEQARVILVNVLWSVGLGGLVGRAGFVPDLAGLGSFFNVSDRGKAEKPPLPGVAQSDPGTVLDNLPAKGSLTAPNMPFTASQEYVLTGAGLQGFYQTSAPNDVWTLSYPEPQLNAQVIKRGPPVPEIVTQGVDVTWELGPQAGLTKDSTTRQGRMNAVEDSFFAASIP